MTENMPDFDSMSPEEIMAWMETLAKRQGASEGFTTSADMDIAEIDPDTVVIDEPGYVPFGQEAPEQPQSVPARAATPPVQSPWMQPPVESPRPMPQQPQAAPVRAPASPVEPPRIQMPPPPTVEPPRPAQQPAARRDEFEQPLADQGSLAWLESLAADQDDSLFNLDLSSISEEQPQEPAATDPVSWLEDLARNQGEMPTIQTSVAPRPVEGDSLTWLESLARRQGAKPEELTTAADLDIPTPTEPVEEPAYTPFSFDTPTTHRTPPPAEPLKLDDPAAFLGSLASEQGYSEQGVLATQPPEARHEPETTPAAETDLSIEGIQQAISEGTVTPEQMQVFLDHETDFALQLPEEPLFDDYDPDAPPVPAELPDWLLEQVGPPPAAEATTEPESDKAADAALENLIAQSSALDNMPDWLKADITSADDVELENIFAQTDDRTELELPIPAVVTPPETPAELEIDRDDPWVEAFDLEHEQGEADVEAVPDWYQRNVSDPARIAAVERLTGEDEEAPEVAVEAAEAVAPAPAISLSDEPLPEETLLPAGALQELPEWMPEFVLPEAPEAEAEAEMPAQTVEEEFVSTDMPDWLREVEEAVSPQEIPDWLKETLAPEEEQVNVFIEPEPVEAVSATEPFTVVQPESAASVQEPEQPRPAPRPAPVAASLETARATSQSGDIEISLAQYEALIRGSVELEAAVEDLSHMVRVHKNNPAVYRVLGDGLMRQGKLQAALDTYREALNQL